MVNLTHLKRLKAQYCGTGRYISRESECSSSVAFVNLRLTISGLKTSLLDGPGCLATRPSHVLQTAFRCAKKFLQIISVKISEEVFIFS